MPGRESVGRGEMDRRDQDCDEVPPTQEPFRLHPGALRRVLALPERCGPLHRRSSRRGSLPHRRGAGQESEHLVIDGGALLPGPRLRGLPGAAAGGDRGVPHDDRRRRRRQRRRPLLLRPLRARGLAQRRLLQPRGNRAQTDPRAGRRLGRRARHRAAHRDRRRRPDGLLRQLPAPHPQPARHPRRDRRQRPAASPCSGSAGSTRTRSSSPSPPAAPTRCCCGR